MDPIEAGASSLLGTAAPYIASAIAGHEHYTPSGDSYRLTDAELAADESELDQLTGQPLFQRPAQHGSAQDQAALKGIVANVLGDPSYATQDWGDLQKSGVVNLALQRLQSSIAAAQASPTAIIQGLSPATVLLFGGLFIGALFVMRAA